jgi:hypothetical protein
MSPKLGGSFKGGTEFILKEEHVKAVFGADGSFGYFGVVH